MNLFEIIILDIIFIVFPILCYVIYMFFAKTLQKEKNKLILDCALFTSIYLLFKYGINEYNSIPLILFDIPLIIAYIKKRNISIVLITIILIFYYCICFSTNNIIVIISYIIYVVIYFIKYKYKKIDFLNISLIVKSIIFYSAYLNSTNFFKVIIVILVFYIMTKCIINIFNNTQSVISLYNSLQKFEDDKQSKESLFKITHEIKNPIAVVKGYLDMYDVDNKQHSIKFIPIIKEEINRVLTLLEDFLCITKIKIEKEEMDLSLLLDDVKNSFELILKEHNVEFVCKDINELYIEADYNRLKQVLVNVIKNGMESIDKNGLIKLSVNRNKNKVKIIVEDNGIGMSKAELEKIKEPFFTTKKIGTGLGIYLSNEIIHSHGGNIKYKSKEGKGTKVTITLPIKKGY